MHTAPSANGVIPAIPASASPRNPYIRDARYNAPRNSMITTGVEMWSADSDGFSGHMPIAGRRAEHTAPAPHVALGLSLDLRFTVLRRDSPIWRMSRVAYATARVVTAPGQQVVTLHTDDRALLGIGLSLTGLAPSASRHVAGTIALAAGGYELGVRSPFRLPLTPGSSRLQALPSRSGGSLYLMTRLASPYDRMETLLTQ